MRRYEQIIDRTTRRFGLQISRVTSSQRRLPVEATAHETAAIRALEPFTMTSAERLWALGHSVRYLVDEKIDGDFVECGVWRGGSVMAMAQELIRLGSTARRIWLYDTFAGMTPPTSVDIDAVSGVTADEILKTTPVGDGNNIWCVAGRADVEANVRSTGYPFENFIFVEGDVVETLSTQVPESIALLRLDTDWYASTKVSLEILFPKLVVGGVCIFDDYGHWEGARTAADEYFAARGLRPFMHPIDYSGRLFIKTASMS